MIMQATIDREEFESLALPLMRPLYGQAYHLTKNAADAEDLVQETYVRGLQRFEQFRRGTNLKAWLSRMLFNLYISDYRKRKRRGGEGSIEGLEQLVGEEEATIAPEYVADTDSRELALDDRFLENIEPGLKSGLIELDPRFRDVLMMNTVGGLSYKEIAAKLKLPIGTVMSRLHRAKTFIKGFMPEAEALAA